MSGGRPVDSADKADPSLSEVLPQTPSPTKPIQEPPYSPPAEAEPAAKLRPLKPTKAELDAIWSATPRLGRERSSRADLDRALTAAMRRGHDPGRVLAGLRAAYASSSYQGDHAKGVHRLIEADRWASFVEPDPDPPPAGPVDPAVEAHRQAHFAKTGEWKASWGPKPSTDHSPATGAAA
ncbi:hypothetical protein Q0812_13305 [Brevundimonas sp. 2R-24]|uniref:Uncharacterized protein n=1 Tax=Peiella sedimenti TaxID=3061083 RepID=A0ABT8SPJ8_9CAUL|nr:hypothetical protein [Caulobacteraceae bacterium XZ-24]